MTDKRITVLARMMVASALCALLLGGLAGRAVAQSKPEGEMRWALYVTLSPQWFDPGEVIGLLTPFWVLYAIHDAVVKPMPGNLMTPSLAESWTVTADQLLARARDQEGRRHRLTRARRRVRHHVAIRGVELHVVLLGDGADRLLEDGLGGDVGDAPATQVDTRRVLPQRVDVVLSASSCHAVVSSGLRIVTRRAQAHGRSTLSGNEHPVNGASRPPEGAVRSRHLLPGAISH